MWSAATSAAPAAGNGDRLENPTGQPARICDDPLLRRLHQTEILAAGLLMRPTCFDVYRMSKMIQIRNVPDALHRRLKSRAALAGMSLSDYPLNAIREVAGRPTLDGLRARLERRSGAKLP